MHLLSGGEAGGVALHGLWPADSKIIEFDPPDDSVGIWLLSQGDSRFLTVVRDEHRRRALADRRPELAAHIATAPQRHCVRNNNADVLILSGAAGWHFCRFRNLRHAEFVAWRPHFGVGLLLKALACAWQLLLRRMRWTGLTRISNGCRLFVFQVRQRRRPAQARHYVPQRIGIGGLLAKLSASGVPHAVLRWFGNLPALPPGEDLDLLVDDDCISAVQALLDAGPGLQPCDLYSVSGLPGTDYRGMPYFPPHLASELLAEAEDFGGLCKVPALRHHFLSLAYHAVYHKGLKSGIPRRRRRPWPAPRPDHDYAAVLGELARSLGWAVPSSLEELDELLHSQGWRPPRDMLVRLLARRELRGLLANSPREPDEPGLAVFILREAVLRRGGLDEMTGLIQQEGFQILKTKVLTPQQSQSVGRTIRGGNWGRGPWPATGGLPSAAVVVYDVEPIPVTRTQRRKYPELTNARLLRKGKFRDAFNRLAPRDEHCNALHSSDNGREALEYIQTIMPEALGEIQEQIAAIKRGAAAEQPVIFKLSNYKRRAKAEVIEHRGQLAVKKTFRAHQRRYCQREARALRELSRLIPEIPPLLAASEDSVVFPYYDDVLRFRRSSGKLLPLGVARQAIATLRAVYEAGYALIDAHPENLVVDRAQGLKLIDFEFLHHYDNKPPTFEQSYDMAGCLPDFAGDLPAGGPKCYARHWQHYVGLSLRSLLHDPPWLQHLKRALFCLVHFPIMLPRRLRHYALRSWDALLARKTRQPPVVPLPDAGLPPVVVKFRDAA